jgi:signal transduction histidine kinase
MRERAVELKAEFQVRSTPGQGSEITLTIPLPGE